MALLVGGPVGVVLGGLLLVAGPRLLSGLEGAQDRSRREQFARDLPLALDLLSACLAGGAVLATAVRAVADAVPGPCGDRLGQVEAALAVGSPSAEAWAALCEGDDPVAGPAARALARAGEGGAPVAA
ncbi:MAG: type secretion system protein, partial [Frankiales bacterium]|nr:type secretion system protein [Frankiales bacterium]